MSPLLLFHTASGVEVLENQLAEAAVHDCPPEKVLTPLLETPSESQVKVDAEAPATASRLKVAARIKRPITEWIELRQCLADVNSFINLGAVGRGGIWGWMESMYRYSQWIVHFQRGFRGARIVQ